MAAANVQVAEMKIVSTNSTPEKEDVPMHGPAETYETAHRLSIECQSHVGVLGYLMDFTRH